MNTTHRRIPALFPLLLALAAALAPAGARAADGDWAIVSFVNPELPFNAREVPLRPLAGGFALTVVDKLWQLVPATLQARVTDSDAKGRPQAVAIVATPPDALAYLRLPGLMAGKVDTPDMRFKDTERDLTAGQVPVPFKCTAYRFETKERAVWFTDGTRHQKIDDIAMADDNDSAVGLTVAWAGDLDRDGKLDVIVTLAGDDGATMCVWMSSKAAPGQLVGKSACFDRAY